METISIPNDRIADVAHLVAGAYCQVDLSDAQGYFVNVNPDTKVLLMTVQRRKVFYQGGHRQQVWRSFEHHVRLPICEREMPTTT